MSLFFIKPKIQKRKRKRIIIEREGKFYLFFVKPKIQKFSILFFYENIKIFYF